MRYWDGSQWLGHPNKQWAGYPNQKSSVSSNARIFRILGLVLRFFGFFFASCSFLATTRAATIMLGVFAVLTILAAIAFDFAGRRSSS
jgi:hypothetical protein